MSLNLDYDLAPEYAQVQSRHINKHWASAVFDGLITSIKGIVHSLLIKGTDSCSVKAAKIIAKVSLIPLALAGFYYSPIVMLVMLAGFVSFGWLAKTLSRL